MLLGDFPVAGPGNADGPMSRDHYKQAVFRAAPSRFTAEMLPPDKQGGSYGFGMRICPILLGDRSSISSQGSHSEYDVWRRWEDCLWFQEALELEYRRRARQKRQRLVQGKGVKKGGFYKQDQASSWESLPPGPDPNSVAQDIHQHIPRLTKKGTVFRASQATIDQRFSELKAFIEALLSDDMPALIKEIRADRTILDFFGYWRRDHDLAEKQKTRNSKARSSVTSSVFSMYFSSSGPNLQDSGAHPEVSPARRGLAGLRPSRLRAPSIPDDVRSSVGSDVTEEPRTSYTSLLSHRTLHHRASSSDSSSAHSTGSSDKSTSFNGPIIADDFPIVFGHNPHLSDSQLSEQPSHLQSLPETCDTPRKPRDQSQLLPQRRRGGSSASDIQARRSYHIFVPSPPSPIRSHKPELLPVDEQPVDRSVRESWQSTASNSTILEGLAMNLPDEPSNYDSHRASISSIATFMTTASADAVIPRSGLSSLAGEAHPMFRAGSRLSYPVSISEDEDLWSELDGGDLSYIYDAFPIPTAFIPPPPPLPLPKGPESRPETPLGHFQARSLVSDPEPRLSSFLPPVPPSPTSSTFSSAYTITTIGDSSSSPLSGGTITIKAAHNSSIIVLRTRRDVTFEEMRQRLYDKFVRQEDVPLSRTFSVAFVLPPPAQPAACSSDPPSSRGRSGSISERTQMQFVTCQKEWEQVTASIAGSKITLRVLDTPTCCAQPIFTQSPFPC